MSKTPEQIKKVMDKISDLEKDLNQRYEDLLKSIFETYPKLNTISIETTEEYDDNNYYTSVGIGSINGIHFPYTVKGDWDISEMWGDDNEADELKKMLFSLKMSKESVEEIVGVILEVIPREDLIHHHSPEIKRETYVKKAS